MRNPTALTNTLQRKREKVGERGTQDERLIFKDYFIPENSLMQSVMRVGKSHNVPSARESEN